MSQAEFRATGLEQILKHTQRFEQYVVEQAPPALIDFELQLVLSRIVDLLGTAAFESLGERLLSITKHNRGYCMCPGCYNPVGDSSELCCQSCRDQADRDTQDLPEHLTDDQEGDV